MKDPEQIYVESEQLVKERGCYFIDQFTYAECVTGLRANNNIAESIFHQGPWVVEIPKSKGGARQLNIPSVIDRLIQQA